MGKERLPKAEEMQGRPVLLPVPATLTHDTAPSYLGRSRHYQAEAGGLLHGHGKPYINLEEA